MIQENIVNGTVPCTLKFVKRVEFMISVLTTKTQNTKTETKGHGLFHKIYECLIVMLCTPI